MIGAMKQSFLEAEDRRMSLEDILVHLGLAKRCPVHEEVFVTGEEFDDVVGELRKVFDGLAYQCDSCDKSEAE